MIKQRKWLFLMQCFVLLFLVLIMYGKYSMNEIQNPMSDYSETYRNEEETRSQLGGRDVEVATQQDMTDSHLTLRNTSNCKSNSNTSCGIDVTMDTDSQPQKTSSLNSSLRNNTDMKIILMWKGTPDRKRAAQNEMNNCDVSMCQFTADRSVFKQADVVYFRDNEGIDDWPNISSPRQLFVHHLLERPNQQQLWLRHHDNRINLTMTYREDADILTPLRRYVPMATVNTSQPVEPYKLKFSWAKRNRSVVWAVSNCVAESKRQDYVRELSKYIDVDIYGRCGNLNCSRHHQQECAAMFETQYKFYLSFENAICQDYITEKFHLPLLHEIVPVVLGGGPYQQVAPPHSYINIVDFSSPKALAKHLKKVGSKENLYTEYFNWKKTHEMLPRVGSMCRLCEAIHTNNNNKSRPFREHYFDWWFSGCDNTLVDRMREDAGW